MSGSLLDVAGRRRSPVTMPGYLCGRAPRNKGMTESDVDPRRGSVLVRHGKNDRRREAGMDGWGFERVLVWLGRRVELPVGPLFCVIEGSTRGRAWSATAVRAELRRLAADAGVRRRFAPHQLRHAHAVELAQEGVPVNIIQRQLGHTDLGMYELLLWFSPPERSSQ
jgi:site-specific recombinase XerD